MDDFQLNKILSHREKLEKINKLSKTDKPVHCVIHVNLDISKYDGKYPSHAMNYVSIIEALTDLVKAGNGNVKIKGKE